VGRAEAGAASHYIDARDFPNAWMGWPLTVEVEAKAKELAVAKLRADLQKSSDPAIVIG
jgi:UV DNA damage repair endonuclease